MTYARSVDSWQWIVGSGVYLDKLDSLQAAKRAALNQKDQAPSFGNIRTAGDAFLCTFDHIPPDCRPYRD